MNPEERVKLIDEVVTNFESVPDADLDRALESSSIINQTLEALKQERVLASAPVAEPVCYSVDEEIEKIAEVLYKPAPTIAEAKRFISTEMDRVRTILKETALKDKNRTRVFGQ